MVTEPIACLLGRYRDGECLAISIANRSRFAKELRQWPPHLVSPFYKLMMDAGLRPLKPGEIRRIKFTIEDDGKKKRRKKLK